MLKSLSLESTAFMGIREESSQVFHYGFFLYILLNLLPRDIIYQSRVIIANSAHSHMHHYTQT